VRAARAPPPGGCADSLRGGLGSGSRAARAAPPPASPPRPVGPHPRAPRPQGKSAAPAPKPTGEGVTLTTLPAMDVYVLTYGGYSRGDAAKDKAEEAINKLKAAGEKVDTAAPWFVAGYDSPYTFTDR
jgi:hypothetical protein